MAADEHRQTLVCPSCGEENFALLLRCGGCGAYIRDRVPALNLFSTLWGMIESPSATVLRIGRSEQKNYTHLLFAACGPLILAAVLFAARIGDTTMPFGIVVFALVLFGPVLGLALLPLATLWLRLLLRLRFGLQLAYRDVAAALAWSLTPIMWASVLLLPPLLAVFGIVLFSTNPTPWDTLPLPFWSLGSLTLLTLPWSMLLLPMGFRIHGPRYRSLLAWQLLFWLLPALTVAGGALLLRAVA